MIKACGNDQSNRGEKEATLMRVFLGKFGTAYFGAPWMTVLLIGRKMTHSGANWN
jgi:hypothetical protein